MQPGQRVGHTWAYRPLICYYRSASGDRAISFRRSSSADRTGTSMKCVTSEVHEGRAHPPPSRGERVHCRPRAVPVPCMAEGRISVWSADESTGQHAHWTWLAGWGRAGAAVDGSGGDSGRSTFVPKCCRSASALTCLSRELSARGSVSFRLRLLRCGTPSTAGRQCRSPGV